MFRLAVAVFATAVALSGDPLRVNATLVRYPEGVTHGFLALSTLAGKHLAQGDLIQTVRGAQVTSRLVFHFRDGSVYDDTAVFTQNRHFRLLSDHVVHKGPAFPYPMDLRINALTGQVSVNYVDDGKPKTETKTLELPADTANGMLLPILKNLRRGSPTEVAYVAAAPEPRLVKLAISSAGDDTFTTAGAPRKAAHYVVKVIIGGIAGVVAPIIGKQPPDSHVWIFHDGAPGFVKSEMPFFNGGPLWRIRLVAPVWPDRPAS